MSKFTLQHKSNHHKSKHTLTNPHFSSNFFGNLSVKSPRMLQK